MSWWIKYPDWFESESYQLQNDSIYTEHFYERRRLFVSSGEIILRRKTCKKYPIVFIYPEATPYAVPSAYLLTEPLSKEEVARLSSNSSGSYHEILWKKKQLVYLRHQMSNGSICFLENDDSTKDIPERYKIKDIIKRIRDWLIGIETGIIPFDSAEIEPFIHYPNKAEGIIFLFSEAFSEKDFVEGEFYLFNAGISKNIYMGLLITGQTENGISGAPKMDLFRIIHKDPDQFAEKLLTDSDFFENKKNKEILKGAWWNIEKEPQPFQNSIELLDYIGNSKEESIEKIHKSFLFEEFRKYEGIVYLGLRYPSRRGEQEWIFFRLRKTGENVFEIFPNKECVPIMLSNYEAEAVRSYKFTDYTHHLRNSSRANRDILREKNISIIGCGAIGSEVADSLSKAGVGMMYLVDNQVIEPNNPIRHVCGLDDLLLPKSESLQSALLIHNPFTIILSKNEDVLHSNINTYMEPSGTGISSIADDLIEAYINEQAIINNRVVFYSRSLRGGKVARLMRVIPGEDACLSCIAKYKLEKSSIFLDIPDDPAYPTIMNECNDPIRPASAADLKLAASVTSSIVINYLQNGPGKDNHWILQTESLPNMEISEDIPFIVTGSRIPPHPDCPACKPGVSMEIRIHKSVHEFMINEAKLSGELETGGILLGFKGNNNVVYVLRATGPGPNAIREKSLFERDIKYCQNIIDEEFGKYGDQSIYIGEWHYHPSFSNKPSSLDLLSLSQIAESENYLTNEPIMIIVSQQGELSCTIHPMGKRYYYSNCQITTKDRDEL